MSHSVKSALSETVALRKESVDRNSADALYIFAGFVALRKESVDRNYGDLAQFREIVSRSPQGERG